MKRKIAVYLRVSTGKQKQRVVPIISQKKIVTEFVLREKLVDDEDQIVYYIDEGFSGTNFNRPDIQRLIEDIKAGEYEIIASYDYSRISRDLLDSISFLNLMRDNNIKYKSPYDQIRYETAIERYQTVMLFLNNQLEVERDQERTNDGLLGAIKRGKYPTAHVMIGYMRDKDKNYVVNPETKHIIENAFDLTIKGYTLREVNNYMNEELFKIEKRRISMDATRKILNNAKYTGDVEFKGVVYNGLIEGIISKEKFKKANLMLKRIVFEDRDNYRFHNKVFCTECNRYTYSSFSLNWKKIKYYYYCCSGCKKRINQTIIEQHFSKFKIKKENKINIKDLRKEVNSLKSKIKKLDVKFYNNLIDDENYAYLSLKINDRIKALKEEIDTENSIKIKNKYIYYKNLKTDKQKNKYIREYVGTIYVDLTKKIISKIDKKQ